MKLVRFGKRIEEDLLEVDAVERDERSCLARRVSVRFVQGWIG